MLNRTWFELVDYRAVAVTRFQLVSTVLRPLCCGLKQTFLMPNVRNGCLNLLLHVVVHNAGPIGSLNEVEHLQKCSLV